MEFNHSGLNSHRSDPTFRFPHSAKNATDVLHPKLQTRDEQLKKTYPCFAGNTRKFCKKPKGGILGKMRDFCPKKRNYCATRRTV
jgi:hypothetical protein